MSRTDCSSRMPKQRRGLIDLGKRGSGTSTVLRWSNRSAGVAHSIGGPVDMVPPRRPPLLPRKCYATLEERMISPAENCVGGVGQRKDSKDTFSDTASRYWGVIDDLSRAINKGDGSIGLPPYNGGLFDETRTPLLTTIRLGDFAKKMRS